MARKEVGIFAHNLSNVIGTVISEGRHDVCPGSGLLIVCTHTFLRETARPCLLL